MTTDEAFTIINEVCPRCAAGIKLVYRAPYKEWGHEDVKIDAAQSRTISMSLCLATHFRNKHQDILNG